MRRFLALAVAIVLLAAAGAGYFYGTDFGWFPDK